jgi:hypothetical protein
VVGNQLVAANLGWPVVFGLLNVVYYVLHYMFASQVGAACSHCGCMQPLCLIAWGPQLRLEYWQRTPVPNSYLATHPSSSMPARPP